MRCSERRRTAAVAIGASRGRRRVMRDVELSLRIIFVWFPGSRLGTSMIYRLRLKTEAEPRRPCVPRREPGNENGARPVVVSGNWRCPVRLSGSQAPAWEPP